MSARKPGQGKNLRKEGVESAVINNRFEQVFNTALATQIINQSFLIDSALK